MPYHRCVFLIGAILLSAATALGEGLDGPHAKHFYYDKTSQTVAPQRLTGSSSYDADIESEAHNVWLTWLQFVPGEGDHLWVGKRNEIDWVIRKRLTDPS